MTTPNNTNLITLLKSFGIDNNVDNYKKVVEELTDGDAFLLLPSDKNYHNKYKTWTHSNKGQTIDLQVHSIDGLKTITAFTSEEALFRWKKIVTKYVSLPAKTIIALCDANHIDRIIIDSSLPTMIVLQRSKS